MENNQKNKTIEFGVLEKKIYKEKKTPRKPEKAKNKASQEEIKSKSVPGRVEESRQNHTINTTNNQCVESTIGSSSSIRLVYNMLIPVAEECFNSLLPTTKSWWEQWLNPNNSHNDIDHAFPFLNSMISDFSFGKSMERWRDMTPGFGPCLAFNAKCRTGSLLNETIENELLTRRFNVDGVSYRLENDGVGFFHGQKGDEKTKQRSQKNGYEPCDPLEQTVGEPFRREVNLELKFAVAIDSQDGEPAIVTKQLFHHGEYPKISVTFDAHFFPSQEKGKGVRCVEEIEHEIITHIKESFVPFLNKNQEQLLGNKAFKNSSNWAPHPISSEKKYTPTHAKKQALMPDYGAPKRDKKKPEVINPKEKNSTSIPFSGGMFGMLSMSDSSDDEDDSDSNSKGFLNL